MALNERQRRELAAQRERLEANLRAWEAERAQGAERIEALHEELERLQRVLLTTQQRIEAQEEVRARVETRITEGRRQLSEIEAMVPQAKVTRGEATSPAILRVLREIGGGTADDVAGELDASARTVGSELKRMAEASLVVQAGNVFGKPFYEAVAEEAKPEVPVKSAVRNWIVGRDGPFSKLQAREQLNMTGLEIEAGELDVVVADMLARGALEQVGFDDLELYEYRKPEDMGAAARHDQERRRQEGRTNGSRVGVEVAGTGRGIKINDPDVRALTNAITRAGGFWQPTGGGHYEVTKPGSKQKVLISATPSNRRTVLTDRARVRRVLGLDI